MKTVIKNVVTGFLLILVSLFSWGRASADSNTVFKVIAPDAVGYGEQFTIQIVVEPGVDIAGAQFSLLYDPAVVAIDSVKEGNLLKQDGAATYFARGTVDSITGRVAGVAGAIITPGQTVSEAGVFADITVTAGTKGCICEFKLDEVVAGDISGQTVELVVVNKAVGIHDNDTLEDNGSGEIEDRPGSKESGEKSIVVSDMSETDIIRTSEKEQQRIEWWGIILIVIAGLSVIFFLSGYLVRRKKLTKGSKS